MRRYVWILSRPGAFWSFLLAFLARLPVSMGPLGMVLLVQSARGSYALAGVVAASFTLGVAAGSPVWGALLDRLGQSRVLAPLSMVSGLLLAVLATGTVRGWAEPALVTLALGVGASFPPISPAMRAAWRFLLDDEADRQAAYALEAVVVEVVFVGGPLLLSAILLLAPPVVPLLVTASLLSGGGAGYALTAAARSWRPEPSGAHDGRRGASPLASVGVLAALVVGLLIAVGFGQLDVSLAAAAQIVLGDQARVGLLFAALAGGSAVGGTVYGARVWPGRERARLPAVLSAFGLGMGVVAVLVGRGVESLWVLLPVLFLTGLSIAPGLIVIANLVDQHAPRDRLGEAQAWLSTAFTAGAGAGTALAGLVVDRRGPATSFAGAVVAVGLAALLSLLVQRFWSGSRPAGRPARGRRDRMAG